MMIAGWPLVLAFLMCVAVPAPSRRKSSWRMMSGSVMTNSPGGRRNIPPVSGTASIAAWSEGYSMASTTGLAPGEARLGGLAWRQATAEEGENERDFFH